MAERNRHALRLRIRGRVQGVGFRYFAVRAARRLGLVGTVRNLPDGDVEVEVAGEEAALQSFKEELRRGPPASRVDGFDEEAIAPAAGWRGFDVSYR